METMEELLRAGKARILDVRPSADFAAHHACGSINIPLAELPAQLEALKELEPIVVCCSTGSGSAQAAALLASYGIVCYDAGSLKELLLIINF